MKPKPKHDELFRAIMSEPLVYREFFEYHLPQRIKDLIDINSINLEKTDFLNEALQESICDILFTARFKNSDQVGYLNLLLEHQSTVDVHMSFRIVRYMVEIWRRYLQKYGVNKKLPMVYPLIFSNAKKIHRMSLDFFDMFSDKELAKRFFIGPYQLIDVRNIRDVELLERTLSGTMEYTLKHGRAEDFVEKLGALGPNFKKIIEEEKIEFVDYITNILCYNIDRIPEIKKQSFKEILDRIVPRDIGEKIMGSIAEKWYNEGIEFGKSQGIKLVEATGEARGMHRAAIATAKNLIANNISFDIIAESTGLTLSEISQIAQGRL